jgi:phosphoenolpyruvate carboxylase
VSGARAIGERFPGLRDRVARRLSMLEQVHRQQIELLRRVRAPESDSRRRADSLSALLRAINCIAAGFGTTG